MADDEREYLPHSTGCFLCGEENLSGVRARFFVEGDEVLGVVSIPRHMNGYKDVAHGGVLAALLDETMGWAATVFAVPHRMFVTAELTVRYLAPVPVGERVEVRSRLVEDAGRLAFCEGEIRFEGKECVRAKGKFSPLGREATAAVLPFLKFHDCRKYRTILDDYR